MGRDPATDDHAFDEMCDFHSSKFTRMNNGGIQWASGWDGTMLGNNGDVCFNLDIDPPSGIPEKPTYDWSCGTLGQYTGGCPWDSQSWMYGKISEQVSIKSQACSTSGGISVGCDLWDCDPGTFHNCMGSMEDTCGLSIEVEGTGFGPSSISISVHDPEYQHVLNMFVSGEYYWAQDSSGNWGKYDYVDGGDCGHNAHDHCTSQEVTSSGNMPLSVEEVQEACSNACTSVAIDADEDCLAGRVPGTDDKAFDQLCNFHSSTTTPNDFRDWATDDPRVPEDFCEWIGLDGEGCNADPIFTCMSEAGWVEPASGDSGDDDHDHDDGGDDGYESCTIMDPCTTRPEADCKAELLDHFGSEHEDKWATCKNPSVEYFKCVKSAQCTDPTADVSDECSVSSDGDEDDGQILSDGPRVSPSIKFMSTLLVLLAALVF